MSRNILCLIILATAIVVIALSSVTAFAATNTGDGAVIATSDGYLLAGKVDYEFGSVLYLLKTNQNGSEVWSKTYGEYTSFGDVFGIAALPDGYVIGGAANFENGTGFYLLKTDQGGNMSWLKTYGGPDRYVDPTFMTAAGDGIVLTGSAYPFPRHEDTFFAFTSLSRSFLAGIDKNGNMCWYQVYDGNGYDTGNTVAQVSDGYLVAGTSVVMDLGRSVSFLVKTDPSGRQIWKGVYGGSVDRGKAAAQAGEGYLLAGDSGYGYLPKEYTQVSVLGTDTDGNETWKHNYLIGQGSDMTKFALDTMDGYLIAGTAATSGDRNDHSTMLFLLKIDGSGNQIWNKTYPGSSLTNPGAIIPATDGYVIAGPANLQGYWQGYDRKGLTGPRLLKTDLNGDVLWEKTYDGIIVREKPAGQHLSPKSIEVSPMPLASPSPAPGATALLSLIAGGMAVLLLYVRAYSGKR